MKKLTIKDLFDLKGKRQLTEVFVETGEDARACEAAGIELLVTIEDCMPAVRGGAPNTFITCAIAGRNAASEAEALRAGFEAMGRGADAIYTGMSLERVRAMAREKIPVVGHVGFVPYRRSWLGGYRAIGKTADEAIQVYRDTVAYQEAGAIGVEVEIVPHKVAAEISKRVKILVISMGAGAGADAQYLFACDITGSHRGHIPRHAKVYCDVYGELEKVQAMRVEAFKAYRAEVESGAFPAKKNVLEIEGREFEKFMKAVEKG